MLDAVWYLPFHRQFERMNKSIKKFSSMKITHILRIHVFVHVIRITSHLLTEHKTSDFARRVLHHRNGHRGVGGLEGGGWVKTNTKWLSTWWPREVSQSCLVCSEARQDISTNWKCLLVVVEASKWDELGLSWWHTRAYNSSQSRFALANRWIERMNHVPFPFGHGVLMSSRLGVVFETWCLLYSAREHKAIHTV